MLVLATLIYILEFLLVTAIHNKFTSLAGAICGGNVGRQRKKVSFQDLVDCTYTVSIAILLQTADNNLLRKDIGSMVKLACILRPLLDDEIILMKYTSFL